MQQNPYEAPEEISLEAEEEPPVPWRWELVPAVLFGGTGGAIIEVAIIMGIIHVAEMWATHQDGWPVQIPDLDWRFMAWAAAWLTAGTAWLACGWKCHKKSWVQVVLLSVAWAVSCASALFAGRYIGAH